MNAPASFVLLPLLASSAAAQVATAPPPAAVQATATTAAVTAATTHTLASPNGRLALTFTLTAEGVPTYQLSFAGRPVIKASVLGLEMKDQPPLTQGFTVVSADTATKDETWEPAWGEVKTIRNNYKELAVTLAQPSTKGRRILVRFRLFDDGLGFRYELPARRTWVPSSSPTRRRSSASPETTRRSGSRATTTRTSTRTRRPT